MNNVIRIGLVLGTLLCWCLAGSAENRPPTVPLDWQAVKQAFRAYVEYPTSEHAVHVVALLPPKHVAYSGSPEEQETLAFVQEPWQWGMLERQVISRDREAVTLAFRLFTLSDGDFTEMLDILLGSLIRIDPELFLEELFDARSYVSRLDGLLGNEGDVYVDRLSAQCLENRYRVYALSQISTVSLQALRDECIGVLDEIFAQSCASQNF